MGKSHKSVSISEKHASAQKKSGRLSHVVVFGGDMVSTDPEYVHIADRRKSTRTGHGHVYVLNVNERVWTRVETTSAELMQTPESTSAAIASLGSQHSVLSDSAVPSWRSLHTGVCYRSLIDGTERFVMMGGSEEHVSIFSSGRPAGLY